uniref:F-box domain-containing protein n=1 Tax=Globodera rostochiensis TaxID=31243 RepID=A0A914I7J8_GLORO
MMPSLGVFICDDVLFEVFKFCPPIYLGLKFALINFRFDTLVDAHFKSKQWSLGAMKIYPAFAKNGSGAQIIKYEGTDLVQRFPLPQESFPDNVIGFKSIQLRYIDRSVIDFLQRFHRLFDSNSINLYISTRNHQSRSWEMICHRIWPLINDNIYGLYLSPTCFDHLRQFYPSVLCNCTNLRFVDAFGRFPEFPADDSAGASSAQALAKWLHSPRGDGRPNVLKCVYPLKGMKRFKRAFRTSSISANFIAYFWGRSSEEIVPFDLKNNLTSERLELRHLNKDKVLLVRCPIKRDEVKWAKWEKEAIDWKCHQWNWVNIAFEDRHIGDDYFDRNVTEFFKRLRRLFEYNGINVCFGTEADESRSWETICHRIWPLINDNIYGLYLFESDLDCLRQFSSTVLEDCAKLRIVYSMDLLPEFSTDDDTSTASSAKDLANWLNNPCGDGRPKFFFYAGRWKGMQALKSEFSNSSLKTCLFIAYFSRSSFEEIEPFYLENNLTAERLELRSISSAKLLLVRCPIKRDEVKWAKWEKEATDFDWGRQWNRIHIDLFIYLFITSKEMQANH